MAVSYNRKIGLNKPNKRDDKITPPTKELQQLKKDIKDIHIEIRNIYKAIQTVSNMSKDIAEVNKDLIKYMHYH